MLAYWYWWVRVGVSWRVEGRGVVGCWGCPIYYCLVPTSLVTLVAIESGCSLAFLLCVALSTYCYWWVSVGVGWRMEGAVEGWGIQFSTVLFAHVLLLHSHWVRLSSGRSPMYSLVNILLLVGKWGVGWVSNLMLSCFHISCYFSINSIRVFSSVHPCQFTVIGGWGGGEGEGVQFSTLLWL